MCVCACVNVHIHTRTQLDTHAHAHTHNMLRNTCVEVVSCDSGTGSRVRRSA